MGTAILWVLQDTTASIYLGVEWSQDMEMFFEEPRPFNAVVTRRRSSMVSPGISFTPLLPDLTKKNLV